MKKALIARITRALVAQGWGMEDCAQFQALSDSFGRLLEISDYYHNTRDKAHRAAVKSCPDCKAILEAEKLWEAL